VSNLFKRETLSGEFLQINTYLVRDLQARGLWNESVISAIKRRGLDPGHRGDPGGPSGFSTARRGKFPMRSLIDMAADRGAYIDQSQSLNLFVESPTIGKLSSMYLHAWKQGLKTTYYLRSRPATRINKTTTGSGQCVSPNAPRPVASRQTCQDLHRGRSD
jgi:ribonucleoside-diphosphate reductase alpha chain